MKSRHLLQAYGRHMTKIELLIIVSSLLSFASLTYLRYLTLDSFLTAFVACYALVYAHTLICVKLSVLELFPRECLFLEFLHGFFYKMLLVFSVPAILILFLMLSYFSSESLYENPLFQALYAYAGASLGLLGIFLVYGLGLMNSRKRFRLSLRSALVGLKLICLEKDENKRLGLVRKYIRWVKSGFRSYNRYLYGKSPMHIEIADIDEYCHSVCCVAQIGHEEEVDLVSEQMRCALDSLASRINKRQDDTRQLLIRSKNIKNLETNDEYRLSELNEMTRMTSLSDRARNRLSSPFVLLLLGVVPIILQILSMLSLV